MLVASISYTYVMLLVLTTSFYFDVIQLGKEKYGDLQIVELG